MSTKTRLAVHQVLVPSGPEAQPEGRQRMPVLAGSAARFHGLVDLVDVSLHWTQDVRREDPTHVPAKARTSRVTKTLCKDERPMACRRRPCGKCDLLPASGIRRASRIVAERKLLFLPPPKNPPIQCITRISSRCSVSYLFSPGLRLGPGV